MTVPELIQQLTKLLPASKFPAQNMDVWIIKNEFDRHVKLGDVTDVTIEGDGRIVLHIQED